MVAMERRRGLLGSSRTCRVP